MQQMVMNKREEFQAKKDDVLNLWTMLCKIIIVYALQNISLFPFHK